MNTRLIAIVIVLIIILAGGWYALTANKAVAPTETTPTEEQAVTIPTEDAMIAATVTLTDSGFSPSIVTVKAGDTVRFVNNSARGMWIGSDDHPTHTEYDGTTTREHCVDGANTTGTFDQCAAANTGTYWEYTFEKTGTFGYHNHVGASNTGTVVVQ